LEKVANSVFPLVLNGKITELADLFLNFQPSECAKVVNLRDEIGKTAIFYSVELNLKNITLWLMSKGADPGIRADNGETIWHIAAGLGNLDCLGIIINYVYFDLREYLDANLKAIKKETGLKRSDVRLGKLTSPDAHLPEV
jgi:ankyrin repeat protein